VYWCFHCYAVNRRDTGACVRCGHSIAPPHGLSYDDQLVWALGHPDGDRAIVAAGILGVRRARSAMPALRRVVDDDRDPFLAVAALRSAIAIADPGELDDWLQALAREERSFMVRGTARETLVRRARG
jgi:hypothetical protein